jgi:adenylate cyclase
LSFVNELKRRNVFRVAIAYLAGAWLLTEVAGTLFPAFGIPDWGVRFVVIVLALGFVPALIISWAYELTPEGLKREKEVVREVSISHFTAKRLDKITIGLIAMALVFILADRFWMSPRHTEQSVDSTVVVTDNAQTSEPESTEPQYPPNSIAVLPFVNMSDDAGNEYFSEGLSEELLNLLVKIPQLRVAARTSSFSYKGKDTRIAQIGEELNVDHVLEGSVRKSGNRIRITAQLSKTDDGFHLWSQTYDRTLDDIFVTQDEIAAAVVDALRVALLGALPVQRPTDPEVYSLYLHGNYLLNLSGKVNIQKAMEAFQQALAIDPEYAPAWSGLHLSYSFLIGYGVLSRDEGVELAMGALDKALEIDDKLASAWAGIAYLKRSYFWDWEGARAASEKALRLEPNNVSAIGTAASIASTFGQLDKAIELFERNVELDPLRLSSLNALANRYRAVGRFDEALTAYNKVLALNPEYPDMHLSIAVTYLQMARPERALTEMIGLPDSAGLRQIRSAAFFDLGRFAEAQTILDEFLESPSEKNPMRIAVMYALRGENDDAFKWLEMALEKRDPGLSFILWNGALVRLSDDPRYPVFLEKMGLRKAWEAMPPEYGGPSKH